MDALGVAGFVQRIQAVGSANTWPYPVFLTANNLRYEVRVRDLGASHPDKVDNAMTYCIARGCHICDAAGVHYRYPELSLHLPDKVEEWRRRRSHRWDDLGEAGVAVDRPADNAKEVNSFPNELLSRNQSF